MGNVNRMHDMKYVVFANPVGKETITIFPSIVMHVEMADLVKGVSKRLKPISAGFINERGECYGESISLGGLESREQEDTDILNLLAFPDTNYKAEI